MVQTQDLDMRIQGCQMQPESTYGKAMWRAYQAHVYMIKLCGSSMQVQAMTNNIKEIKGTTVNPKWNKYMYFDKSESEKHA